MITDKDVEELFEEFKEWRKDRKRAKYESVVPSQTAYSTSQSYQYTIKCPPTITDWMSGEPYTKLMEVIKRMENTAKGLTDTGAMNFGLSLKSEIEDLKKLLWGIKE